MKSQVELPVILPSKRKIKWTGHNAQVFQSVLPRLGLEVFSNMMNQKNKLLINLLGKPEEATYVSMGLTVIRTVPLAVFPLNGKGISRWRVHNEHLSCVCFEREGLARQAGRTFYRPKGAADSGKN